MASDGLSIEQALADLRTRDSAFGDRAALLADQWRTQRGSVEGPYEYPERSAYSGFYPPFVPPRRGARWIAARLLARVGLARSARVRTVKAGDHIVFLPPGCELPGDFASNASDSIRKCKEGFVYADSVHYVLGENADYVHQVRPGWSPERLRSHCYVGEVVAARRDVVMRAGGARALRRISCHDRALRLADAAESHRHLDVVLHTSLLSGAVPPQDAKAVAAHCERTGIDAAVVDSPVLGSVRVDRRRDGAAKVCVIMPTRGSSAVIDGAERVMAAHAVSTLLDRATDSDLEILAVVDADTTQKARDGMASAGGDRLRFVEFDGPFNFAKKINLAAVQTDAEFLLLMNDDTELLSAGAVGHMLSFLADGSVGLVSPVLLYDDHTVQSAGHLLNPVPFDLYRGFPMRAAAGWGMLGAAREVSSLLAAFLLVPRDLFLEVGGLSEEFPSDYNDVDLALKIAMAGRRAIVTPHVSCLHFESKTRTPGLDPESIARLGRRWQHVIENDPHGNTHLQPYELVWKSNEDTFASLDAAVGGRVRWRGGEWTQLQNLPDRHLHRTMFFPKWLDQESTDDR